MAGKNLRSQSGKKGVGMSAPGRPKGMAGGGTVVGLAPPTGLPKQTTPTMYSSAGKVAVKKKGK